MDDVVYGALRHFADSWGLLLMVLVFCGRGRLGLPSRRPQGPGRAANQISPERRTPRGRTDPRCSGSSSLSGPRLPRRRSLGLPSRRPPGAARGRHPNLPQRGRAPADDQPTRAHREVDAATQTETTGHEWDGIKELDTPMPRWWLWTFYAHHRLGGDLLDPVAGLADVTRATPGLLGYSSRQQRRRRDRRRAGGERAARPSGSSAGLRGGGARPRAPALSRPPAAPAIFRNNCAACHGAGAGGVVGHYPEPARRRLALGRHRGRHPADRHPRHPLRPRPRHPLRQMPAFGDILRPEEIDGLVAVRAVALGAAEDPAPAAAASRPSSTTAPPATARRHRRPRVRRPEPHRRRSGSTAATPRRSARPSTRPLRHHARLRRPPSGPDIAKVAVYVTSLGGGEDALHPGQRRPSAPPGAFSSKDRRRPAASSTATEP